MTEIQTSKKSEKASTWSNSWRNTCGDESVDLQEPATAPSYHSFWGPYRPQFVILHL